LFAVEAIAGDDEGQFGMDLPYLRNQSFTRIDLAVLLFRTIGIPYLFRGKGDDVSFIGMHYGRLDDLVKKTVLPLKASVAVNLPGREVFGTVYDREIILP